MTIIDRRIKENSGGKPFRALERVETRARERFPGVELRWAYTSRMIRAKLGKEGQALLKSLPGRKSGDGVIFMGHGSEHHPADAVCLAMNQVLQELDPATHVAAVEGSASLESLIAKLKKEKTSGKCFS
jgi:cobalamin biosynthesis Co2+ chelatase CbiK